MSPSAEPTLDWRTATARYAGAGPELLIGLDIDGTILHRDGSISPRVKDAIHDHIAAGTHIVIATGRGISGTQVALETIGIADGLAVSSNGAIILSVGDYWAASQTTPISHRVRADSVPVSLVRAHTFDPTEDIEVIARALPQAIFAVESLTQTRRVSALFPPGELTGATVVVPREDLAVPDTTRLTVREPTMTSLEMLAEIEKIGLSGMEYAIGWSAWMDVAPTGINKAVGLSDVQKMLGTRRSVAIGDSGNDCDMLQWANLGIAMGDSYDYVRTYADAIAPSIDDDGLAQVLEALL